jgi:hypothetical protein
VSATRVARIHPASNPSNDVLTGTRSGSLGFWKGPTIDVVGFQQVNPHVSRDIAKQWLIDEGEAVDARVHADVKQQLSAALARADQAEAAVQQLQSRLGRVYPKRRQSKKVRTT